MNLVFNIRLCIYPQIRFPTMSSPEFSLVLNRLMINTQGISASSGSGYGVAQFFDGKLDVGFG